MEGLTDTNTLLRYSFRRDPQSGLCRLAARRLWARGDRLFAAPQVQREFWGVATRPLANNGFGMTVERTHRRLLVLERLFPLLPDSLEVQREWRRLVVAASVSGRQVHDAYLAALASVHGVSYILTLNGADFTRFTPYTGVGVLHPADV